MDTSGVSPEAAVMAVAQSSARQTAVDVAVAAMAKAQHVQRQTGEALVGLIRDAVPKPGVGQNLDVCA
jgi:hypothetical protein